MIPMLAFHMGHGGGGFLAVIGLLILFVISIAFTVKK